MPTKSSSSSKSSSKSSSSTYNVGLSTRRTNDMKFPIKMDGTKDKRYNTPQFVKKDGTRDMRTTSTKNRK